jgi:hypothetical protein
MSQMSGLSRALVQTILVTLLLTCGCSRRTPNVPSEGATQSTPTPFQSQKASIANSDLHGFVPGDALGKGPPFQNSQVLPAGALVTVRLKIPLVAGSGSSESFEAVLDEPVVVEGNTMIPRDALVSGRIESTHTSRVTPDRGYVRLTLDSVQVDGFDVPLQTASLFARSLPTADADSDTIRLEKGRRMTFRLKDPVFLQLSSSKTSQ